MTDRKRSLLTEQAARDAKAMLAIRPQVVPGTRAIVNRALADQWHKLVIDQMAAHSLIAQEQVDEFCDLAGVAD